MRTSSRQKLPYYRAAGVELARSQMRDSLAARAHACKTVGGGCDCTRGALSDACRRLYAAIGAQIEAAQSATRAAP